VLDVRALTSASAAASWASRFVETGTGARIRGMKGMGELRGDDAPADEGAGVTGPFFLCFFFVSAELGLGICASTTLLVVVGDVGDLPELAVVGKRTTGGGLASTFNGLVHAGTAFDAAFDTLAAGSGQCELVAGSGAGASGVPQPRLAAGDLEAATGALAPRTILGPNEFVRRVEVGATVGGGREVGS
jgi:hypothetical protein